MLCYENVFFRDRWPQLTQQPWWHVYVSDGERQVQWERDIVSAIGQDWLQMFPWTPLQAEENTSIEIIPEGAFRVNQRTGRREKLELQHGGEGALDKREPPHESAEALDAAIFIPGKDEVVRNRRRATAAGIVGEFGERLWTYRMVSSPLWRTYKLWGFEGMMTMIAMEPDLVRHACERFLELELVNIREAAEHGTQGIWIEECLTDMIGPRYYAELNMPYLRRLIDAIREAGMKSIYYYCGDPAKNWDMILSLGMDALGTEESKKGFSTEIDEIVDRVAGRYVVLGNLDAFNILQDGSDDQLRAAIQHQLDAGRRNRGRFIMSLGSPVTPDTPIERVRRYCDLVRESVHG